MNKIETKNMLLAATLLATLVGCTTSGKRTSDADLAKTPGEAIVQQQGRTEPVVSQHEARYWLDMRQAKGILPRLDGALATGEVQAAVDLARSYLKRHPGEARALTSLAAALTLSKNYELGAYYAGLALGIDANNASAMNIKAMATMLTPKARLADLQRAAQLFQQAIDADATQVAAGLNLGSLYLEIGNAKAAASVFEKTAGRCDQCTPALMGLGIALSRTGQKERAVEALEGVLAKHPKHSGALYQLALVYKNGYNDHKKAEKYLHTLLAESRTSDVFTKERAQTVLRMIKGEATAEERTALAEEEGESAPASSGSDKEDAELLMSSSEFEDAAR